MIERITSKNEKNILMKRFSQLYKQTHFQKRVAVFLRHIFWRNHINNVSYYLTACIILLLSFGQGSTNGCAHLLRVRNTS